MKISDKTVYIIGYRKRSIDSWESMDKVLYNEIDAQYEVSQLKIHAPNWQYRIFKAGRFM